MNTAIALITAALGTWCPTEHTVSAWHIPPQSVVDVAEDGVTLVGRQATECAAVGPTEIRCPSLISGSCDGGAASCSVFLNIEGGYMTLQPEFDVGLQVFRRCD